MTDLDIIFWAMWMRRAWDDPRNRARNDVIEEAVRLQHEMLLNGDVDAGRWHSDPGHHD
jgi:hypothetical protein